MKIRLLILMLLIAFLLGCKGFIKEDVNIGVIIPLTGTYSSTGESMKNGFELALDEINNNGGINNKDIKFIYEDEKCDSGSTKKTVERLIEKDKVAAFLGIYCEDSARQAERFAFDAKKIFISSGINLGRIFHNNRLNEYFFSTRYGTSTEAQKLAVFTRNYLGLSKVGIIYFNDTRYFMLRKFFKQEFEGFGGNITFELNLNEINNINAKIKNLDGIFLAVPNSLELINKIKETGFEGKIFVGLEIQNPGYLQSRDIENVYYAYPEDEDDLIESQIKLKEKYKAKYGKNPDLFAQDSYDALNLLAAALKKCETIYFDGSCMSEVIMKTRDYNGSSGKLTFDKNLWGFHRVFIIKTVKDGSFVK